MLCSPNVWRWRALGRKHRLSIEMIDRTGGPFASTSRHLQALRRGSPAIDIPLAQPRERLAELPGARAMLA